MQVEKVVPETVFKVELSAREYLDVTRVLYFAKGDTDYDFNERARYGALHSAFNANA